jgi:outer membrane protein TolC
MWQLSRIVQIVVLTACFAAPGCARYRPAKLDPQQELDALRGTSLADFVVRRAEAGGDSRPADLTFDPSDGLGEAEVVAVALALNPHLRAKRLEVGEAQALLITAGHWPNPEVGVSWRAALGDASGYSVEADALFELLRPGERAARRAAAGAKVDEMKAAVVAAEFTTVAEVRVKRLDVLVAEQVVGLLGEETQLREQALDLVRRQRRLGEGTELDLATAELEVAEVRRELRQARGESAAAKLELNRLLGLPPEYALSLEESGRPLTVTVFGDLADEELDRRVLAGRPELRAAEAVYAQAEQELRLAILGQYPRLGVGPDYERELEGDESLGLGLSLELPLLNQNQGEIAEKRAQRERRRAEYAALLHRLRTDAFAARAGLRQAAAEVEAQEAEIQPLVKRTQDLLERALRVRELSVIELVTAQQRTLRARREYLEALARYRKSAIQLETATGLALSQPAPQPDGGAPAAEPGARGGPSERTDVLPERQGNGGDDDKRDEGDE